MNNYININGKKIALSEETALELEKQFSKFKVGFSKHIGIYVGDIAIFGERMLKSYSTAHLDIGYNNNARNIYEVSTPAYEEIRAKDLKVGDVFYNGSLETASKDNMVSSDFGVVVGKDGRDSFVYQYLFKKDGVERVCHYVHAISIVVVVRFLRKPFEE